MSEEMAMQYQRGYIDGFKEGKATATVELFRGMTNGEVMNKLFPEISECLYDEVFSEYWWNYPYKSQERSK